MYPGWNLGDREQPGLKTTIKETTQVGLESRLEFDSRGGTVGLYLLCSKYDKASVEKGEKRDKLL